MNASERSDGSAIRRRFSGWRAVAAVGALSILVALLADQAGIALLLATCLVPAALVVEARRLDPTPTEPAWGMAAALLWGWAVGLISGTIASIAVSQLWLDGAVINAGAAGFGGAAVRAAGPAPLSLLFLVGIVLTASSTIAILLGPLGIRQAEVYRDEVMDGVAIGLATGAAFAAGSACVAFWPIVNGSSNGGAGVADWTAIVIGLLVVRPLIYGIAIASACAGIWRAALDPRQEPATLPVAVAVGGLVIFVLGDLAIAARGARVELLWHVVALGGFAVIFIASTRQALAGERVAAQVVARHLVCPQCGRLTPPGRYCSYCGEALVTPAAILAQTPAAELDVVQAPEKPPSTIAG